jgi:hypothetical protein
MSAADIAAKLTKAQRDTMLGHMVEIPPEEADALEAMGLKEPSYVVETVVHRRVWPITPLGLEVRNHLKKGQTDD